MQRRAFVRTGIAAAFLAPSIPAIAQPLELRTRRRSPAEPIRLSSNENPLGVPESARAAIIEAIAQGHRYPQLNGEVRARIAQVNRVDENSVVLGNGSAEILQMTVEAMIAGGRGMRVILPDPTFEQVERYTRAMGAEVVKVPLLPDHTHDLARMRDHASQGSAQVLVFICNPNNPTGTVTPSADIAAWIREAPANIWFLVDEAYVEFVGDPAYRSMVAEATSRDNVLVSRTFSKIYGLAGIRLGYGLATPDTVQRVNAFAAGTNINHLAASAALACIDDADFVRRSLEINRLGREAAYRTLRDLDIEALPSHANFVMHRVRGDLRAYITRMREAGIVVGRAFPPMLDWNRVSIGLPAEMDAWSAALRSMRSHGQA